MRVIAGSARRTQLKTLEGMNTRPTQDRIKETLFNMLQYDLADCAFLDLFAGSGGIGIEALSRGAGQAVFVEQNEAAFNEFLEDYKASTEFVNANVDEAAALVAGYEIVPKEPIAQKALPECNITFISGADMKAKVSGYLKVLYDQNPEAVGGTLPDDAFYYGA